MTRNELIASLQKLPNVEVRIGTVRVMSVPLAEASYRETGDDIPGNFVRVTKKTDRASNEPYIRLDHGTEYWLCIMD